MKYFKMLHSQDKIDIIVAIAGVTLGLVISFLNIIYSNAYLTTIGPMLIIVCLAYIVFWKQLQSPNIESAKNTHVIKTVNIIFWVSLMGSNYSLITNVLNRPIIYFILISVCASAIALQILLVRGKRTTWLILFEIFLVSLSVRASAYYIFPSLVGSDPWEHLNYIQDFVNTGRIATTDGAVYYLNYPITHLNAAVTHLITGTDYKTAMFLGIGLPMILSTIYVFLVGKNLGNIKVGLLATLLVNLSDTHIGFGVQLMPTTYGVALFSFAVYLLSLEKYRYGMSMTVIMVMVSMLLIITHNMSSFILFCFMVFWCVGMLIYSFLFKGKEQHKMFLISPTLALFFGIAMLAYWAYAGYLEGLTFLEAIVIGLYNALHEEAGFLARSDIYVEPSYLSSVLNITGFLFFYLFGTLGFLFWSSSQTQSKAKIALFLTTVLLTAFALIFPVFGIRNIQPYRWFAFIYVILSLPAAFALLAIACRIGHQKMVSLLLCCAVFTTSFFMITNNKSNLDSPIYALEQNERLVYTESEIAVARWALDVYDGRIVSDAQYTGRVIGTYLGRGNISHGMLDDTLINSSLVIWRGVMAERPVQTTWESMTVLGEIYEQKMLHSHNLIYSNGRAEAFLHRF